MKLEAIDASNHFTFSRMEPLFEHFIVHAQLVKESHALLQPSECIHTFNSNFHHSFLYLLMGPQQNAA